MKTKYIRLVTFAAIVSILFLQGMWLYHTYKLLETEFRKNISNLFILSLEKEAMLRVDDPERKGTWKQKAIKGVKVENDHYTNNRALQDYLFQEDYPLSLEKLDSIFNEDSKKNFDRLDYSFQITDSLKNQTAFLNHGTKFIERFAYKETILLRNIAPEYITLVVSSPYKIIFGKMLLLLIGSFLVAILVGYGLILQVRIINKQDKIAKMRQDFTHAMIHDIKNPITSILMSINLLKSGKIDDNQQKKENFYNIIDQESNRILKLANKILEIAHFEGKQVTLSKQLINLSDLLRDLTDKYTINTMKKVCFHIELNNVKNIYADPHYIYESFGNLIDNAVKYSKENEDADITITGLQKENETQLIFKDKGIGIAEKDQKKIFEKFERSVAVISSKNKISGFGLGLNFVHQVIKAHGGTIKVNSRLGSYSEFIINLPYNNNENDKVTAD